MRVPTIRRSQFIRTKFLVWLLVFMLIWFVGSSVLWWKIVYTSPENVFRDMLAKNFSTQGYSRFSSNTNEQVEQSQTAQIQFGQQNVAQTHVAVINGKNTQKAEVISTPSEDYLKYTQISNPQTSNESKAVGVWARNDQSGNMSQSFNQLTLFSTYFPMGIVKSEDRSALLDFITENTVYNATYKDVVRETINGRGVYTYKVSVQLQSYVDMLKMFATATGQGDRLAGYSPTDFQDAPPVPLEVSVDIISHRLVRVIYSENDNTVEAYGGYGITNMPVELPNKYLSPTELQELLRQ
jgi:hypothetical protein